MENGAEIGDWKLRESVRLFSLLSFGEITLGSNESMTTIVSIGKTTGDLSTLSSTKSPDGVAKIT